MKFALVKNGGTWECLDSKLAMRGPAFERLVLRFLGIVADEIYRLYVERNDQSFTIAALMERSRTLKHFMFAC